MLSIFLLLHFCTLQFMKHTFPCSPIFNLAFLFMISSVVAYTFYLNWYHFSFQYFFLFSPFILLNLFSSLSPVSMLVSAIGHFKDSQPNRILLVTIHHMLYPITVEVLHQVFSPHGYVEKIVTFQKSAGQALSFTLSFSLSWFLVFWW